MKARQYTEEQIIAVLREGEAGAKVVDLCRKYGMSDATYYNWKAKYAGLTVSELKRLKSLEDAGVLARTVATEGIRYTLTEAGRELKPIILQMGIWGHRWARSKLTPNDLDPSMLMWDIHRTMDAEYFDNPITTLYFEFSDYTAKFRRWWLVVRDGEVDVCMKDPGHDVDLDVITDVRTLTGVWMGDISLGQALRDQRIRLTGETKLKKDISTWLGRNYFASIEPAR